MITIDVANAYHQNMVGFVAKVREEYPDKVIVAGNVVTPEMTEELIISGADLPELTCLISLRFLVASLSLI